MGDGSCRSVVRTVSGSRPSDQGWTIGARSSRRHVRPPRAERAASQAGVLIEVESRRPRICRWRCVVRSGDHRRHGRALYGDASRPARRNHPRSRARLVRWTHHRSLIRPRAGLAYPVRCRPHRPTPVALCPTASGPCACWPSATASFSRRLETAHVKHSNPPVDLASVLSQESHAEIRRQPDDALQRGRGLLDAAARRLLASSYVSMA